MTSMAVSSAWYYRFEKHKLWYGSIMFVVGAVLVGLAGHDMVILRNIATGNYDLNAARELYLNMSNYSTVDLVWDLSAFLIAASIAYMVIVKIAHSKIAKDNFPLA